jgi:hypothetical protein
MQHHEIMSATWQNNICNISIILKKNQGIDATSQICNCNITKSLLKHDNSSPEEVGF